MPKEHFYIPGDRYVECDVCAFTMRRSQVRKGVFLAQKGLNVCPKCFDPVHPNERHPRHRPEGKLVEIR